MLEKLKKFLTEYRHLQQRLQDPAVFSDIAEVTKINQKLSSHEDAFRLGEEYERVVADIADAEAMLDDPDMADFAQEELVTLRAREQQLAESLKIALLPQDPNDAKNVILEIRAGAGGDESALFAEELLRMYLRFSDLQGWKHEVLSRSDGDHGVKDVSVRLVGQNVYSTLKYEGGVHRVQRVPATEAKGRIHTSTVTVVVLAEVEDVDIHIPESDLKMDIYRSAGAGGQNVQKNSTAVRLTHLPTGIVVACQDERSQLQNKVRAMSILKARLYEIEEMKRQHELEETRRSQAGTGERSEKIRTYNYPQNRVTDHRINVSSFNLVGVMDGDIDQFIDEISQRDEADRLSTSGEFED